VSCIHTLSFWALRTMLPKLISTKSLNEQQQQQLQQQQQQQQLQQQQKQQQQ
jgi:hypothetical protein